MASGESAPTNPTETSPTPDAGAGPELSPSAAEAGPRVMTPAEMVEALEERERQRQERLRAFEDAFAALPDEALRVAPDQPAPSEPEPHPHASKWGNAALNGKPFSIGEGLWPSSAWERSEAERMYEIKKHLGTLTAASVVAEHGVYEIGKDGKSGMRVNGSLDHLPRSFRKSIKRAEKNYAKTVKKREHALHELEHSGSES